MKALLAVGAVGAVLAGWYLGPLVRSTGGATSKPPPRRSVTAVGPIAFTARNLEAESHFLRAPIFWAGPARGYRYEFVRSVRGALYVRYLPPGVRPGSRGTKFLVVAAYPFVGAFKALRRQAHGRAVGGPGGSIVFVRPGDTKSVLLAFPNVDYEIEIYDPSPVRALATAQSGNIRPVG